MRVVHVGSVVVDLVADVPALAPPGGGVLATALRPTPGGGFNVLAAVARQGVDAVYAGPHGTGPFGDLVRAALAAEGVTVLGAPRAVDTGLVVTLVDATGERTFVTSPDAAVGVTADDLARVLPAPGDIVSVSGYGLLHPASRDALVAWVAALPPEVVVAIPTRWPRRPRPGRWTRCWRGPTGAAQRGGGGRDPRRDRAARAGRRRARRPDGPRRRAARRRGGLRRRRPGCGAGDRPRLPGRAGRHHRRGRHPHRRVPHRVPARRRPADGGTHGQRGRGPVGDAPRTGDVPDRGRGAVVPG
ncbi:hypothetical protein I4I73_30615 [Pseudonocardia sp. KRD-184]|uniref:Carbohydrate kinase PfkB domain-containing protein n=1 Tax=Pseudonocardia oceani TaxID=2792013 RepID=A0ABS6U4J7_9PSEU|nr:hypothetical protein [Pseudonocardia oceani]MBW0100337.1 hypothetical protein [Pseudonocardia oceani]MBW0113064.1 hypothetical protein [Pseudonocardia oceani]MBW0124287.1 hypothetical protein [Pseudonocardia oceani]MBW0126824.1 hypothetical protein [Pseudonocardia oceani]